MKKSAKKSMKMSTSKKEVAKGMKGDKAMSPQDKFKAMIAAKKEGKSPKKLSYGAKSKKGAMKMSTSKKLGKK